MTLASDLGNGESSWAAYDRNGQISNANCRLSVSQISPHDVASSGDVTNKPTKRREKMTRFIRACADDFIYRRRHKDAQCTLGVMSVRVT